MTRKAGESDKLLLSSSKMMQNSPIDHFSNQASAYAARYGYDRGFQQRRQVWTKLVDRYAHGRATAYDMGCGSGILSFHMAHKGLQVRAFDGAPGMIALCQRTRRELEVQNATFTELLVCPESLSTLDRVDLIVCSSLLEYIPDLQGVVSSLARLLTPKGVLLASIPNRNSLYRNLELLSYQLVRRPRYFEYVRHVLTLGEIQQLASRSGLHILEHAYFADRKTISRLARFALPPAFCNDFVLAVMGAGSDF